jgi:hypothetical protein
MGRPAVSVTLDLHVRPPGNYREHWQARSRRVSRERRMVHDALAGHAPPPLPVVAELTRVAWARCDSDGLAGCFKSIRDELAAWLGVDDRSPLVRWRLSQEVRREHVMVRGRRGWLERRTLAAVRVVVRPWVQADGEASLVVL